MFHFGHVFLNLTPDYPPDKPGRDAMKKLFVFSVVIGLFSTSSAHQPEGEIFFVVQFPDAVVPTIDGESSDWDIVPGNYAIGIDKLYDPSQFQEAERGGADVSDMNITHRVGWNDNLNKLYFVTTVFDNVHNTDRADPGPFYKDDALEVEVNMDHSAREDQNTEVANRIAYKFAVPPIEGAYAFSRPIAGVTEWLFPGSEWLDFGWSFTGEEFGESTYTYELSLTPFESFPLDTETALDGAIVWDMEEGDLIHLALGVGDIDEGDDYWGFWSTSPTAWNTDFVLEEMDPALETGVESDTWARIKAQFE